MTTTKTAHRFAGLPYQARVMALVIERELRNARVPRGQGANVARAIAQALHDEGFFRFAPDRDVEGDHESSTGDSASAHPTIPFCDQGFQGRHWARSTEETR